MKSVVLAASLFAGITFATVTMTGLIMTSASAAPPAGQVSAAGAPVVPTLSGLVEKELHWGMSHADVIDTYNKVGGLYDREYNEQLSKLQPGVAMQQLEADRDSRKAAFERSLTRFQGDPTGYDVTALRGEFTYKNDESIQRLFKDGKTRFFFYIKDRLWKIYDEVPLKDGGTLGATYQDAIAKLSAVLKAHGRVRTQGLDRTEADWQDRTSHLRAVDRSGEHLVGLVLEDKGTLANLMSLRSNKPVDPFALDPSIAAITKNGVTDPNAKPGAGAADAGAGRR